MNKTTKQILLSITFIATGILYFILAQTINAQTCSGNVTVPQANCTCNLTGLNTYSCSQNTIYDYPSCIWDINLATGSIQCLRNWNQRLDCGCTISNNGSPLVSCSVWYNPVDNRSFTDGCYVYTAPSSTPAPTSSSLPGPDSCTGTCFDGISNCGEVGYESASGTCSVGLCCQPRTGDPDYCNCCNDPSWTSQEGNPESGFDECLAGYDPHWETGYYAAVNGECALCAPPTCTISLNPKPMEISVGEIATLGTTVTQNNGTIKAVTFSSSNLSVVTATSPDTTPPTFTSTVSGIREGNATIYAAGIMDGGVRCTDSVAVSIVPSWWQAVGGDVVAQENIYSKLPLNQSLIKDNTDGNPGLAIYASNIQVGDGNISSTNQKAKASSNLDIYNFYYFQSMMGSGSLSAAGANNISDITDPTAQTADGYVWINHYGNWTTTADIVIPPGRKVVVFVNGNVNIDHNITITDSANSYFMLLTSGNIIVDPIVTTMHGVYYADWVFHLPSGGTASTPFTLKGTVFAGVFSFSRFIDPAIRDTTPAETFEFDPALVANYPSDISPKKVVWQEILP